MNKNKIFDFKMLFYDIVKVTGAIPTLIILRLKRVYLAKREKGMYKGPYLIMSNHISYIDPVILSTAVWWRRLSFIATKELFDTKRKSRFFNLVNCIEIDKENVSMKTFKKVKERLDDNRPVAIFPEGGVEQGSDMTPFKSGVVLMAIVNNVPIIPMYIEHKTKWYQRQRVMIGEKINLKYYIKSPFPSVEEIQNVAKMLEAKEKELEELSLKTKRK